MALMTNEKFIELLNAQIAHENTNSMIYLSISNWFGKNFLKGWQKYFNEWQCEEIHHRDWIIELMTEKGCSPMVGKIEEGRLKHSFKNIKEVLSVVLKTEEETTEKLNHILTEADKDAEWDVVEIMTKMVKEQIEEEMKARKLLARLTTADWSGITVERMNEDFL